jgi:uncharacterized protein
MFRFSSPVILFKPAIYWLATLLMLSPLWVQAADKGLFWKMESPTGVTSYLFEEFEQVRELADFHVMHLGAAMQMKPWLLAVIFDLPKPQTPFAQDNLLMTKSEDLSKDVVGIETPQEHFGVMDSFSLEEQMVMLRAVLKRTPEQKEKDFEKLINAYLKGDAEKIASLDEQITGGMLPKPIWQKMRAKLLDERNVVMAQRSIAKANEGPTFVAVGASHLAGKTGLIAAFKEAGFTLTPLKMR